LNDEVIFETWSRAISFARLSVTSPTWAIRLATVSKRSPAANDFSTVLRTSSRYCSGIDLISATFALTASSSAARMSESPSEVARNVDADGAKQALGQRLVDGAQGSLRGQLGHPVRLQPSRPPKRRAAWSSRRVRGPAASGSGSPGRRGGASAARRRSPRRHELVPVNPQPGGDLVARPPAVLDDVQQIAEVVQLGAVARV
jgi:hypothetical protein